MLSIRGLTKRFGPAVVFEDFSLDVAEGSFTALLGPSGCGKSTLFDVLTGVAARDGGHLLWRGEDRGDLVGVAAYMQQKDLLLPWLSLEANVLLPLSLRGVPSAEDRRRAEGLLEAFGLGGYGAHRPRQVSGGMRQRCALARTVMADRELVLLDEPLSALDAVTRLDLQELLLKLHRSYGRTIVMVTHDVDEALRLADSILLLSPLPMTVRSALSPAGRAPRPSDDPELLRLKGRLLDGLRRPLP